MRLRIRSSDGFLFAGAALLMVAALLLQGYELFGVGSGDLLASHLLLELAAVVVTMMVVIVAFFSLEEERSPLANSLILVFTLVAGIDLAHALSYPGMPPFLGTPNDMSKAAFFWMFGRAAEVLGFTLALCRVRLPGGRWPWFLLGIAGSGLVAWLGGRHLAMFPPLFLPGVGVTAFKAASDYALCAGFLLLAWRLWRKASNRGDDEMAELARASYVLGIGELAFTGYASAGEWQVVLGHVYKVVAYIFVFRAIFLSAMRRPYQHLHAAQRQLELKEQQYRTLVDNLPIIVMRLDLGLRLRLASPLIETSLGGTFEEMRGRPIGEILPSGVAAVVMPALESALRGQAAEVDYVFASPTQGQLHRHLMATPERAGDGQVQHVLVIIQDTSARERAQQALQESMRETRELKAALDAHAIVAVTDRRGVIVQVNNKFCEISQYAREELVGRTHAVVNSGFHPKAFFTEMWATIARGEVWNGELCNRAKDGSLYWVQTTIMPLLGADGRPVRYIAIRADITRRKLAEQEAQQLAFYDVLTGLPNRRLMNDRLAQVIGHCRREQQYGALVLIDLDHFKEVNDTLGHAQGDALLRLVADRLRAAVRGSDTVARLGGDEFVLLLEDLGSTLEDATAHAADLGEKIRSMLAPVYVLDGQPVVCTPSLGIVMLRGDLPLDAEELLKRADLALYKAKDEGRNELRFFDPALQEEVNHRTAVLRDLRAALEEGQLRLYYQPIIDASRRVVGVEGLLRWQHPVRGLLSPGLFMPLAEQSPLIVPIGHWVLDTACAQLAAWAGDPVRADWTVAVNVSARQLRMPEFVGGVEAALARSGAPPQRLRLEITESLLQEDLDDSIAKMQALRELGVRFSLDDFGTGYSSLNFLKRLPLDQFKIDQSFVQGLPDVVGDVAIIRMILALSAPLELLVVAEGVETEAQFEFLRAHGCHKFQGYLFGRPMPAEALPGPLLAG